MRVIPARYRQTPRESAKLRLMADDVHDAAWTKVGQRLQQRIFEELRLSKAEFIRLSGITSKTLDGYLAGRPIIRADKARALCDAVGWTQDSLDRIRRDEEPVVVNGSSDDPSGGDESRLDAVERQVAEALQFIADERANLAREREAVRVEREELLRDRARLLAEMDARLGPREGTEEPNDSPAA